MINVTLLYNIARTLTEIVIITWKFQQKSTTYFIHNIIPHILSANAITLLKRIFYLISYVCRKTMLTRFTCNGVVSIFFRCWSLRIFKVHCHAPSYDGSIPWTKWRSFRNFFIILQVYSGVRDFKHCVVAARYKYASNQI